MLVPFFLHSLQNSDSIKTFLFINNPVSCIPVYQHTDGHHATLLGMFLPHCPCNWIPEISSLLQSLFPLFCLNCTLLFSICLPDMSVLSVCYLLSLFTWRFLYLIPWDLSWIPFSNCLRHFKSLPSEIWLQFFLFKGIFFSSLLSPSFLLHLTSKLPFEILYIIKNKCEFI